MCVWSGDHILACSLKCAFAATLPQTAPVEQRVCAWKTAEQASHLCQRAATVVRLFPQQITVWYEASCLQKTCDSYLVEMGEELHCVSLSVSSMCVFIDLSTPAARALLGKFATKLMVESVKPLRRFCSQLQKWKWHKYTLNFSSKTEHLCINVSWKLPTALFRGIEGQVAAHPGGGGEASLNRWRHRAQREVLWVHQVQSRIWLPLQIQYRDYSNVGWCSGSSRRCSRAVARSGVRSPRITPIIYCLDFDFIIK